MSPGARCDDAPIVCAVGAEPSSRHRIVKAWPARMLVDATGALKATVQRAGAADALAVSSSPRLLAHAQGERARC